MFLCSSNLLEVSFTEFQVVINQVLLFVANPVSNPLTSESVRSKSLVGKFTILHPLTIM